MQRQIFGQGLEVLGCGFKGDDPCGGILLLKVDGEEADVSPGVDDERVRGGEGRDVVALIKEDLLVHKFCLVFCASVG